MPVYDELTIGIYSPARSIVDAFRLPPPVRRRPSGRRSPPLARQAGESAGRAARDRPPLPDGAAVARARAAGAAVTGRPTGATVGGRAYLDLRKAASVAGRPTDEFLQLCALEGFLDRLGSSPHAEHLMLKGGVLLAAYDARRPTRDIDLAGLDVANDLDNLLRMINEIIAIGRDDGLEFDLNATGVEAIHDEEDYGGGRVTVHGGLSTGVIQFHVDINIGDPLWPPPDHVDLAPRPGRATDPRPRLPRRTHPRREDRHSLADAGTANTR